MPSVNNANPAVVLGAGVAASVMPVVRNIADKASSWKLQFLLKGVFRDGHKDCNKEKLFNYIKKDNKNAETVSDLISKSMNSQSKLIPFLYGLILSAYVEKDAFFSGDDMLICYALSHAIESDVIIFNEIFDNLVETREKENQVVGVRDVIIDGNIRISIDEIRRTCLWANNNRLFSHVQRHNSELVYKKNENGEIWTMFRTEPASFLLKEHLDNHKSVLEPLLHVSE